MRNEEDMVLITDMKQDVPAVIADSNKYLEN